MVVIRNEGHIVLASPVTKDMEWDTMKTTGYYPHWDPPSKGDTYFPLN